MAQPKHRLNTETPLLEQTAPRALLPLTPKGVAAFGLAGYGRLLAMQLISGLLIGLVVAWFVRGAWFPPAARAIDNLPIHGQLAAGRLDWTNASPVLLAANPFLAFVVDLEHTGILAPAADLQIEFGLTNVYLSGFLGSLAVPYPQTANLPFNRRAGVPWWGAWNQAILAGVVIGATFGLMLVWAVLALAYIPIARVTAWLYGCPLNFGAAWRLCAAALIPGAVLMTLGLGLYGWNLIDLLRLGFIGIFHLLVGLVMVPLSVLCLPRPTSSRPASSNPFAGAK